MNELARFKANQVESVVCTLILAITFIVFVIVLLFSNGHRPGHSDPREGQTGTNHHAGRTIHA